jgi:TIR domain
MIIQDFRAGSKIFAIAFPDVDANEDPVGIAECVPELRDFLDAQTEVIAGHQSGKTQPISTKQMVFTPRVVIYTNRMTGDYSRWHAAFSQASLVVEIVDESELYKTVFISYGGTDAAQASEINAALRARGVKTWFFPLDALPGQKLHRVMYEGVNQYDRVLLICSKGALDRSGLLNELERVLEREAKDGGSEILMPVTLDGHVYKDWAPGRNDLAAQVRSRVIGQLGGKLTKAEFDAEVDKIVQVLSRSRQC